MHKTRLPACQCPYCGTQLDAATKLDRAIMPKPGDISVCIKCAQILVFTDDLMLRKPDPNEIEITDEIKFYQQAVRSLEQRH